MRTWMKWAAGLLAAAVLAGWLGWRWYRDQRDMRIYVFDDQAVAWLDALPNTCGTCALDRHVEEGYYLFHMAEAETFHPLFQGPQDPLLPVNRRTWEVHDRSVTAPYLKANFCDDCIAEMVESLVPDHRPGGFIAAPRGPDGRFKLLPVQDGVWSWTAGGSCLHIDQVERERYTITRIAFTA